MTDEYPGEAFKSGYSVALRLPKGLGVGEGQDVRIVRRALLIGTNPVPYARATACEAGDLARSAIGFADVGHGAVRVKGPPMNVLETFVRQIMLVELDRSSALRCAELPFTGGSFDRLVGAHALSLDPMSVTNNVAGFADIPGLRVEDWTV